MPSGNNESEMISLSTVKLLLNQQREDFNSMIATLMKSQNERYDQLRSEMVELKVSLQYSQKDIDALKETTASSGLLETTQEKIEDLGKKIDYLENQSRQNNILFEGIPESPNETWDDTEAKVHDLLKSKLGFTEKPDIERAHRIGAFRTSQQRPVIVKFNRYKDRAAVLKNAKNLKGTSIYAKDDVSEKVLASRKSQMEKLRDARSNGKIAYFSLDRLIIKERDGRPHLDISNDAGNQHSRRPATRSQPIPLDDGLP